MVIVLRKIKVRAAALRTIYNTPHRLFIAAVRFGIVLLRYTLQHVPHLRRASGPAVCRKGIVPLTRLRRANAPLFAVGKIMVCDHFCFANQHFSVNILHNNAFAVRIRNGQMMRNAYG